MNILFKISLILIILLYTENRYSFININIEYIYRCYIHVSEFKRKIKCNVLYFNYTYILLTFIMY